MTFKDLMKGISLEITQQQFKLFDVCSDKPFWIWDEQQHMLEDIKTDGDCCFNHIIGLPTKEGMEKAIFDYEKILYDSLLINDSCNISNHSFKHKHLWIKKATGLGVRVFS